MVAEVAVLTFTGALGPHAVPLCRAAVDWVLRFEPVGIVLDVRRVAVDETSIAVSGMLRRYVARHGTPLWLAGVPFRLVRDLRRAGVADEYRIATTVESAVQEAVRLLGRPVVMPRHPSTVRAARATGTHRRRPDTSVAMES
jgi:hypothetical protein